MLHFLTHSPSPPPLSVLHYHLYLPLLWVSITTTSLWWAWNITKSWSCGEQWMLENQRRTILTLGLHPSIIVNLTLSIGGLSQTYLAIDAQQTHQWKYIIFVVNLQASPFIHCQSWTGACVAKNKVLRGLPKSVYPYLYITQGWSATRWVYVGVAMQVFPLFLETGRGSLN